MTPSSSPTTIASAARAGPCAACSSTASWAWPSGRGPVAHQRRRRPARLGPGRSQSADRACAPAGTSTASALAGDHVWVVGRPGSAMLHSANRGGSWEIVKTGAAAAAQRRLLRRRQARAGPSASSAQSWPRPTAARPGPCSTAAASAPPSCCVHARPTGVPLETLAALGADDGYLAAALRVSSRRPGHARLRDGPPSRCAWRPPCGRPAAPPARRSGSSPCRSTWARATRADLIKSWDGSPRRRGGRGAAAATGAGPAHLAARGGRHRWRATATLPATRWSRRRCARRSSAPPTPGVPRADRPASACSRGRRPSSMPDPKRPA